MNKKSKIKKYPVSIRLTDETIQLARKLTKLYMEDESKLGELIEEAILFYSTDKEDQSGTNALLKVTKDNLLNQFREQVESMYREFKNRDKLLAERIASLIAIQGFESTLTELLLKDIYSKDDDRKKRYEELRRVAARKMKDRYTKSDLGKMAELTEKITRLENEIQENDKKTEIIKTELKEHIQTLAKRNETLGMTNDKQNRDLKKLNYYITDLEYLIKWYERRDNSIPKLQEKNKNKLGIKQSYEKSKIEFEKKDKKPVLEKKPKIGR